MCWKKDTVSQNSFACHTATANPRHMQPPRHAAT